MKNSFIIARREISSAFSTPLAYAVTSGYLILSGFFFFNLLSQFNSMAKEAAVLPNIVPSLNQWVVIPYYRTGQVILLFVLPFLTMRLLAEERKSGTIELLFTAPISFAEIIWGKFIGLLFVVTTMLVCSFVFPAVLICYTDAEIMPMLIGFGGLVLYAAALGAFSFGVGVSATSQTLAGTISLVCLLMLYVIDAPAQKLKGRMVDILQYLSPASHMERLIKGVVVADDLMYFASLVVIGLFIGVRFLEFERGR